MLTGSARLLGLRSLPDTLVGRSETVELWPFSQGEIDAPPMALSTRSSKTSPISIPPARWPVSTNSIVRCGAGSFPEATGREPGRRRRFFQSYLNDLIDRDVTLLSEIQRRAELDTLLRVLVGHLAAPLRIERIANAIGLPKKTVERYVSLFEEVFFVKRIDAWSSSLTARATRLPSCFSWIPVWRATSGAIR